jgi:hypothetical protein
MYAHTAEVVAKPWFEIAARSIREWLASARGNRQIVFRPGRDWRVAGQTLRVNDGFLFAVTAPPTDLVWFTVELIIRHTHHPIRNAIGFALKFVVRFADFELWLDYGRTKKRGEGPVSNRTLQTIDGRNPAVRSSERLVCCRSLRICATRRYGLLSSVGTHVQFTSFLFIRR